MKIRQKRVLAYVLAMVMVLNLCAVPVKAEATTDFSKWNSGIFSATPSAIKFDSEYKAAIKIQVVSTCAAISSPLNLNSSNFFVTDNSYLNGKNGIIATGSALVASSGAITTKNDSIITTGVKQAFSFKEIKKNVEYEVKLDNGKIDAERIQSHNSYVLWYKIDANNAYFVKTFTVELPDITTSPTATSSAISTTSPAPDNSSPTPDNSSPTPDNPSSTPDNSSPTPNNPNPTPDNPSPTTDKPSPTPTKDPSPSVTPAPTVTPSVQPTESTDGIKINGKDVKNNQKISVCLGDSITITASSKITIVPKAKKNQKKCLKVSVKNNKGTIKVRSLCRNAIKVIITEKSKKTSTTIWINTKVPTPKFKVKINKSRTKFTITIKNKSVAKKIGCYTVEAKNKNTKNKFVYIATDKFKVVTSGGKKYPEGKYSFRITFWNTKKPVKKGKFINKYMHQSQVFNLTVKRK